MTAEQVQAISSVATVVIALATWYIAWKQNSLAKSQTELVDQQTEFTRQQTEFAGEQLLLGQAQKELSERLTRLEEARDTPIIVAGKLERIGDTGMSLSVYNAGGGSVRSIFIQGATVAVVDGKGVGRNIPLLVAQTIPFLRDEQSVTWTVAEPFRIPVDLDIQGVIAMQGIYYTQTLERKMLEFESMPGALAVLRSQGWPELDD